MIQAAMSNWLMQQAQWQGKNANARQHVQDHERRKNRGWELPAEHEADRKEETVRLSMPTMSAVFAEQFKIRLRKP